VHIEHVLPSPARRLRIVLRTVETPVGGIREWVFGDAAQETHFLIYGSAELHAVDEYLQILRIILRAQLLRAQVAGFRHVFVLVNGPADLDKRTPVLAFPLAPDLGPSQGNGHRGEKHHDREGHDQLHQGKASFAGFALSQFHRTLTVTTWAGAEIGCPWELRRAICDNETGAVPLLIAWKRSVTSTPDPLTPAAPGIRFRVTEASPESLRIFMAKLTCCPSRASRSPCTTESSRSTLGSYLICIGAAARSVILSAIRLISSALPAATSACGGTNRTAA